MKDPHNLLQVSGENAQAAKFLRFTSPQQVIDQQSIIVEYIQEAINIESSGAKIEFKQKHELEFPQELIQKFNEKFKMKHGSLICKKLTGFDISTPEGLSAAREEDVFHTKCPAFIKTACHILEDEF